MKGKSERAIELFTEAVQLPVEERAPFLDRACADDEDLRDKIEAWLRSNDRAGDFLEEPPETIGKGRAKAVGREKPGDRVGRYKLLRQIGEGGCGVVFLAEQEEPIRRRVALKVIKPGMDTKSVIARFAAERQALALMDHPNIAHVFDAGASEKGRPYFVMELVEGEKISDYCARHSFPTGARLELFVQVCDAIQHAHQKGIIHRDIKPSNILVTTGADGKPAPKVIDFGIAKATGGHRLTDDTIFTAGEMLIGTPAYMSPEQAAMSSIDVDTRTDIYSLGVLLYELLTGTTPFDTQKLLKAGLDEVRRVVREEDPVRPSTRLTAMGAADLANISKHHGKEVPKLIREMRGDLDWITMKALEKDRTRRYASANGLAVDVGRYLAGEAVWARPPSASYKFRKLVARNRILFAGLGVIFILLVIALAVTSRLLIVETQRRELGQHQQEVFQLESLAVAQWSQRNMAEANKCFQQGFGLRRQFLGGHPPNAVVAAAFVELLEKENKGDEASAILLAYFSKTELLSAPGYSNLFGKIGTNLAKKGRWKEALENVVHVVKAEPDFPSGYHALLPLLVACGDVAEYRRLCPEIISRFGGTQDPATADQMAKDCLILPASGADLKAVGALADVAVTRGKNYSSFSLFKCCKALAEYRQEHLRDAVEWATSATKHSFPYSKAEGYAILAMAQYKSGQISEARVAFADCVKVIEETLPKLNTGDLGGDWRDWIIAHTLQQEADTLINQRVR